MQRRRKLEKLATISQFCHLVSFMLKRPRTAHAAIMLGILICSVGATFNASLLIPSSGRLATILGRITPGDDYLYFEVSNGGKKVGTKYWNSETSDFNFLFAQFGNYPDWAASKPRVKAGIINESGTLLGTSVNEITLQPIDELDFSWHVFKLPQPLTLPSGYYYLCLWIETYGGILYRCQQSQQPTSFVIGEDYTSPTGKVGGLTIDRDFDIFATYSETSMPPRAGIDVRAPETIEVGSPVTFDGSFSFPGFNGTGETKISYEWDFGDGTTSTEKIIEKTYSSPGDYACTLRVTDSQGFQDIIIAMAYVKPVGGYSNFIAGFESSADFLVGEEARGNFKYWGRECFYWGITTHRFEPEAAVVHSGRQSAKLQLLNPASDQTRRIQIYHDIDPFASNVWQEYYVYIPTDIQWYQGDPGDLDTIDGFWYAFGPFMSERKWESGVPMPGQQYAYSFGVIWHKYRQRPVFDISSIPVYVDNNDDGVNDYNSGTAATQWSVFEEYLELGPSGVPTGTWIHVKMHFYRNADWATNPKGGHMELWLTDETSSEQLYKRWDNVRTVGIDPQRIASLKQYSDNGNMAYVDVGISLYQGALKSDSTMPYGVPSRIYVDDYSLTSS